MRDNYPQASNRAGTRLLEYASLVEESADRLGLVARGDLPRLYDRHLRESLAPPLIRRIPEGAKILDVGSGGGFPGVPVAVLRADVRMTLVEPRDRKAAFLERVILRLGLANTWVFPGTLEEFGRRGREPEFDLALSRGLRWTREMIHGLDRVLAPGGALLRFGSLRARPGVPTEPLAPDAERSIQVWGRSAWGDLPGDLPGPPDEELPEADLPDGH